MDMLLVYWLVLLQNLSSDIVRSLRDFARGNRRQRSLPLCAQLTYVYEESVEVVLVQNDAIGCESIAVFVAVRMLLQFDPVHCLLVRTKYTSFYRAI